MTNDRRPLTYRSRVSSGKVRVLRDPNRADTYMVAQLTNDDTYAVGFYAYTADDLLDFAAALKDFVFSTRTPDAPPPPTDGTGGEEIVSGEGGVPPA